MARQDTKRWVFTDHACRHCGGRVMQCVAGGGPTGGGNPVWQCADCEVGSAAMGPECICWCGFEQRANNAGPGYYACVRMDRAKSEPAVKRALERCGCFPDRPGSRSVIGIVVLDDLRFVEAP